MNLKRNPENKKLSTSGGKSLRSFVRYGDLYLLLVPVVAYFLIFQYLPMYGIQIAFKDFSASRGIFGSEWVGFKHFLRFFRSYRFESIIRNTVGISLYSLVVGFPFPIIFALMVNEITNLRFKKLVQTISYLPHFLSTVVVVSMLMTFLSPSVGVINRVIEIFGGDPIYFMTEPSWFKSLYVFSGIWQSYGWNSIIYLAAIASIDRQQYEAADVDGATTFQKMRYVTLPGIMPTAVIMLILQSGSIMSVGFEKVFLMQNNLNVASSEVISTYVYKVGLLGSDFSFSASIGLFNSVINFGMLMLVNAIARRVGESSLW